MDIKKHFDEAITLLDNELSLDLKLNPEHEYQFFLDERVSIFLKGDGDLRAWKFLTVIPVEPEKVTQQFLHSLLLRNGLDCKKQNSKFSWNPLMQEVVFQRLYYVTSSDPSVLKNEAELFTTLTIDWCRNLDGLSLPGEIPEIA